MVSSPRLQVWGTAVPDLRKKTLGGFRHNPPLSQGLSVLSTKQMASEVLRTTFLVTSHPVGLAFLPGT